MKLLNKIKSLFKSDSPKEYKIPKLGDLTNFMVYRLGSPDPVCFANSTKLFTPSGIDFVIKLDGKVVGCAQGLSFLRKENILIGSLVLIRFYNSNELDGLFNGKDLGKKFVISVESADSDGNIMIILDNESIKFTECAFGVSIDDIVTEYHFAFESFKE